MQIGVAREKMRIIELDATRWETPLDFTEALKAAIGAPVWHGSSVNAFVDSMVTGGINTLEPPYVVRIKTWAGLRPDVLELIDAISSAIEHGCADGRRDRVNEGAVSLELR